MKKLPIILFAFANDLNQPLASLEQERRNIQAAFQPLQGKISPIFLEGAKLEDIFQAFTQYRDQIVFFHYAGHASSEKIFLEGTEANAQGLAKLLGEQRQLAGVFLNACATQKQVSELLRLNIQAVLATTGPVHDDKATDFATRFYQSLVTMATTQTSFNEAVSWLESQNKIPIGQAQVQRFLGDMDLKEKNTPISVQPWGLYVRDEAALLWGLKKVISQEYRLPNIRKFLVQGLSDSDFDSLCMDYFPEVFNQLGDGMARNRKVIVLLDYCRRYERFAGLLEAMQDMNPTQYANFEPYD